MEVGFETNAKAEIQTLGQWRKLSSEEKVEKIMEAMENCKYRYYREEYYEIRWKHVIHIKIGDEGKPSLVIQPIRQWIKDNEVWITDDLKERSAA